MKTLILIFALFVFFIAVKKNTQRFNRNTASQVPSPTQVLKEIERPKIIAYQKKDSFLTNSEKVIYTKLVNILGGKYLLFSQIGMLGVFDLKRTYDKKEYFLSLHKIQAKRLDFLICNVQTTEPLLAIELDDRSHLRLDRVRRDEFVDQLFEDTGLPLLRLKSSFETEGSLKEKLKPYLPGLTFTENANKLS